MEDEDDDAEMADYGTDVSDDVDQNFDAKAPPRHSGIGNRIPRFPDFFAGRESPFPIWPGNREPRFAIRPGTGNRGPDSAGRRISWSASATSRA